MEHTTTCKSESELIILKMSHISSSTIIFRARPRHRPAWHLPRALLRHHWN